jgi:hypothetical protein
MDFLYQAKPAVVFVAGHSLGGTVTPPLAGFFLNNLRFYNKSVLVAPVTFAGLTSGNPQFASYMDQRFSGLGPWRYHNTLDIAPFLWNNKQQVFDIYNPWGVACPDVIQDAINYITEGAPPYAQPNGDGAPLPGVFEHLGLFKWEREAAHQHASLTYVNLMRYLGRREPTAVEVAEVWHPRPLSPQV